MPRPSSPSLTPSPDHHGGHRAHQALLLLLLVSPTVQENGPWLKHPVLQGEGQGPGTKPQ